MSQRWPGGLIKPTPITPTGPYQDGSASGVWTLDQMEYWLQQGLWPIAGNINVRGLFGGGATTNVIQYIQVGTTGNATDFGDLTQSQAYCAAVSSSTRAVFCGSSGADQNVMGYVTISTTGNATDFGDISNSTGFYESSGCGSSTRGLIQGGRPTTANQVSNIYYITIATTGNASNFGNLTKARNRTGSCSSSTRGICVAGDDNSVSNVCNIIDYTTIASTGNATDFGDLLYQGQGYCGCSNSTRGLFIGGYNTGGGSTNTIQYITIASTGNAVDFGDISIAISFTYPAACSSSTRGVFRLGSGFNIMEYVTIATTGNAVDFGDLLDTVGGSAGCSNGHGGL